MSPNEGKIKTNLNFKKFLSFGAYFNKQWSLLCVERREQSRIYKEYSSFLGIEIDLFVNNQNVHQSIDLDPNGATHTQKYKMYSLKSII